MTDRNRILAGIGVLILCSVLGASQALGQNVTIGGKVLTADLSPTPVGGATVSVHPAGTPSTTTAGDGSWSLSVPAGADPVLKIGATATTVETYTTFRLTLVDDYQSSPYQFDIRAFLTEKMSKLPVPAGSCAVLGFAVRYTSLGYPVEMEFLSGVDVNPDPFAYIDATGEDACLLCTETTESGGWAGFHEDGYSTPYSGSIPDPGGSCAAAAAVQFAGGDVTCVADTVNFSVLYDVNLPPLP
jgi:hypothetical protein